MNSKESTMKALLPASNIDRIQIDLSILTQT